MKTLAKSLVVAGVALAVAVPAVAQDAASQAINARKAYMTIGSFYLGQLGAMAKGEVDYNAEAASAAASSLENLTKLDQSAMWPQGTDNVAMAGKTRALPAIWETWPAIAENGKAYGEAVASLAASAGDGLEALQAGVGAVGKECGACHDKFRGPRN